MEGARQKREAALAQNIMNICFDGSSDEVCCNRVDGGGKLSWGQGKMKKLDIICGGVLGLCTCHFRKAQNSWRFSGQKLSGCF